MPAGLKGCVPDAKFGLSDTCSLAVRAWRLRVFVVVVSVVGAISSAAIYSDAVAVHDAVKDFIGIPESQEGNWICIVQPSSRWARVFDCPPNSGSREYCLLHVQASDQDSAWDACLEMTFKLFGGARVELMTQILGVFYGTFALLILAFCLWIRRVYAAPNQRNIWKIMFYDAIFSVTLVVASTWQFTHSLSALITVLNSGGILTFLSRLQHLMVWMCQVGCATSLFAASHRLATKYSTPLPEMKEALKPSCKISAVSDKKLQELWAPTSKCKV